MAQFNGQQVSWHGHEYVILSYSFGLDMFICREVGRLFKVVIPVEEVI